MFDFRHNQPIDHEPISMILAPTSEGDLRVTFVSPFFNSPVYPPAEFPAQCPPRHTHEVWLAEAVELFLLNSATEEYFQLELDSRGRYTTLLLKGSRMYLDSVLPLDVTVDNPCLDENNGAAEACVQKYTVSAVVPRAYLPPGVDRFNAYAIHGVNYGEELPEPESKVYEALFPVEAADVVPSLQPDFHLLSTFQPIDLSQIGFQVPTQKSDVWQRAEKAIPYTYK